MKIKFTKMQGCGNDYVYIDSSRYPISKEKKAEIVRFMSDRHFGIGGDGVIFIHPSTEADFEMEMYNADGTGSEMCGNGIRCVAKYVYDKGLIHQDRISIISAGKVKYLDLTIEHDKVSSVKVNMGVPELEAIRIPVKAAGERAVHEPIEVQGKTYFMTCVSVGNPHAIVFMEDVATMDIEKIGPFFENHERFPNRVNTEFVKLIDRKTVEMRVWERGTGETLACGTGCCATVVACILNGLTDSEVTVKVLGGELQIAWQGEGRPVYMTGPAATVFEGEIEI